MKRGFSKKKLSPVFERGLIIIEETRASSKNLEREDRKFVRVIFRILFELIFLIGKNLICKSYTEKCVINADISTIIIYSKLRPRFHLIILLF